MFLPCLHHFPLQILICCMCATFTADSVLALVLGHTLQLYPLELVETPLVPSRSGCVWLSHRNSMVDTILHRWARNHCLLTCPCCVCGFAGSMLLKTNPSDPPPEEITLGSLGCRCTCVEQGVKERRREHGASFKDQRFQLQTLLFCNLGYFLAVHMEKKRGIVW